MTRLKKALDRTGLQKGGKRPKGKYNADVQKLLDTYRDYIKNPAAAEQAIQHIQDTLASGVVPTMEEIVQAQVANEVYDVAKKGSKDINAVADTLESIIDTS